MPHSTYSKKKSFHLLEGTMNLFYVRHRNYEIMSKSLVPNVHWRKSTNSREAKPETTNNREAKLGQKFDTAPEQ